MENLLTQVLEHIQKIEWVLLIEALKLIIATITNNGKNKRE